MVFANAVMPFTAACTWPLTITDNGAMHNIAGGTMPLVNFPASEIDIPKDRARFAAAPIRFILMSLMPIARSAAAWTGLTATRSACNASTVLATTRLMSLISLARTFTASVHGFGGGVGVVDVVAKVVVVDATVVEVVGTVVEVVGAVALEEKVFRS